jgi:Nif-specific regulatory protein
MGRPHPGREQPAQAQPGPLPAPPHHGFGDPPAHHGTPLPGSSRPYARVREDEAEHIRDALRRCAGNKTRAALLLGMTPRQLRYRLGKLGIGA